MRVLLALLLVSCAEPFAFDRHHLRDFRIVEAHVQDGMADAVIWSGEGPFHSYSPLLRWYIDGVLVAEGFDVAVPEADVYQLEVENRSGDILYADVGAGYALDELSITRMSWEEDSISDFSLESRQNVTLFEPNLVAGHVSRVLAENRSEAEKLRWSSDAGSILEVSSATADIFRDHLIFEEGELIERQVGSNDTIHVFLLSIDGLGGSAHTWVDIRYHATQETHYSEEMIVDIETDLEGLIRVDIEQNSQGYTLQNPTPVSEPPQDIPHPCMDSALMDLHWIRAGRCSLQDLDGLSVVLELR